MWAEGKEIECQCWVTWGSGPPGRVDFLCLLALLGPDPGCTTSILWWIAPGLTWPYDLIGWTGLRSSWAILDTWSLDVPWLGTPSQPGLIACQELFFQMVYNSLLQMAWPCSRTLGVFIVILLLACHKLHMASSPTTDTSNNRGAASQTIQAAGLLKSPPRPDTKPFPILAPTQWWQPSMSLGKCIRIAFPSREINAASKIQRDLAGKILSS